MVCLVDARQLDQLQPAKSVEVQLGDYHVEGPRFLGGLDDRLGVVKGEADQLLCSRQQVGVAQPGCRVQGEVVIDWVRHHVRHLSFFGFWNDKKKRWRRNHVASRFKESKPHATGHGREGRAARHAQYGKNKQAINQGTQVAAHTCFDLLLS